MTGTSEDHVREWLDSKGVALEFRTAREFSRVAHNVQHSRYYEDPQAPGQLREVDVIADTSSRMPSSVPAVVRFVIECKSSTAKPWVAFRHPHMTLNLRDTGEQVRETLEGVWTNVTRNALPDLYDAPILALLAPHHYQLTDCGERGEAYGALRQVISATRGLLADVPQPQNPGLILLVPVIVTAAQLFSVSRADGDEEPRVEQVERALVVSRLVPGDQLHSVWVVQADGLAGFVDDCRKSVDELRLR